MSGEPSGGKGPGGQLRLGRGDVVGERWRLDEFLKGGGMGRVWRATDLRLLEPVAVKLLDPAGLAADGARERFFREAQAAASERQAKQDRFDERYAGIANLLIGLLRLSGKPDLAARVRLSWRRSPSEPAGPADPEPAPSPPTP
mgnify:CR=1 FL=1